MAKSLQGLTTRRKKKLKTLRKFGFRKRMMKWTGRNVIKRRRRKGREELSVSSVLSTSKMAKDKKFRRRK